MILVAPSFSSLHSVADLSLSLFSLSVRLCRQSLTRMMSLVVIRNLYTMGGNQFKRSTNTTEPHATCSLIAVQVYEADDEGEGHDAQKRQGRRQPLLDRLAIKLSVTQNDWSRE